MKADTGPPGKKPGWIQRMVFKVTPVKWHDPVSRYFTKETFIVYNISSWITAAQFAVVSQWQTIAQWGTTKVLPGLKYGWGIVQKTWDNLMSIFQAAS
jgi:phage major head subunit gpT-like protein